MNSRIHIQRQLRPWTPPNGLDRSRPRLVRLTASGKALLALAIALVTGALAAGAGLGIAASRQADESRLLREEGVVTEGSIIRLWRSRDKNKQPWVAYRFSSQGRIYEQGAKVPLRIWRDLRVGSYLSLRYVPSRPELNCPLGSAKKPLPLWVPFLVALFLVACGLLATLPLRSQRRLLAGGRPAPGLVTHHGKEERGPHGSELGIKYYYEFPLLSGAIAKGQAGPCKNAPAVGSTITVLYDPDNRRRNAPYPFSLVRLAHLRMS